MVCSAIPAIEQNSRKTEDRQFARTLKFKEQKERLQNRRRISSSQRATLVGYIS